ncbi:MAG TPA: protein kinase, partial [Kofleriaceae bacterium]|nr:protein kinase [Kofleriaceae bacterium]
TLTPSPPPTGGSDSDLQPGQVVGEYEVEHKLGQGGFGAVFKAVHPLIGKQVAIKVLSHRFSVDPQMVSRFVSEARAVNQIRHPNIIDIFSFKTLDDGRLYYVMEYLDGEPLDRRLARGRMSLAEAIPILRGIARALDAAHGKGIAHRDLKAENVFLAAHPDGVFPKLLDFGIAKLMTPEDQLTHKTRTGAPMGTPHYMSPEQCHGRDVDHRTDMYAFGVLAYLMLTGVYPLDGDDYMAILMRQVHDEPQPPSSHAPELPAGVNAAVAWLMRKDPAARPETLMAVVRMLEKVASGEEVGVPPPGAASDSLSTLPIAATVPESRRARAASPAVLGKPTPEGNLTPPGALLPPGQPTPAGLPAAPVSAAHLSGELPGELPAARGGLSEKRTATAGAAERRPAPHVLLAGGALLAAAVIIAVIVVRSGGRGAAQDPSPPPPTLAVAALPDAAAEPPDAAPPAAGRGPAQSAEVFVTIEGPPEGTEVRRAGVLVGTAPGKFQLPRSETPSILLLSADGYFPEPLTVVPSEDLTRTVTLRPKPVAGAGSRPPQPGGAAIRTGSGSGSGKPAGGGSGRPARPGPGSGAGSQEPTNDLEVFPEDQGKPAPRRGS